MTYGPEEASGDVTLVRENTTAFEARARLEHFLLSTLREQGNEAVTALLQSLRDQNFRQLDDGASGREARYLSQQPDSPDISGCHLPRSTFSVGQRNSTCS